MTARPNSAADGWSEERAWRSLDLVLAWLSELVGFRVASVNVVRGDQLQLIALSGVDEGVRLDGTVQRAEQMIGTTWPVEELLLNLDLADDWGRFKFIPHERAVDSGPSGWILPSPSRREGLDAWHEEDVLLAPLYDDEGTLIGCLSVDDPGDGRRPAESMWHLLDEYAGHVNLSLLNALQRSRLADRARILDETRTLLRQLSETPEIDLDSTHARIMDAFQADAVVIHTFGDDGATQYSSVLSAHAEGTTGSAMLERRARHAWDRQTAYAANAEEILAGLAPGEEHDVAAAWMKQHGIGAVLFAPLGAGAECLGSISISRRPGRAPWTEQHREAAREFGQDLGRILHAGRVLKQEQHLVSAQRDLDHAKIRLIAAVSRELSTPLDAITSISSTLDPTSLDRSALSSLYRAAHRAERVIEDLLLLSRLSDPDASIPDDTVDLADVARHTVGVVEAASGADVILQLRASGPSVAVRGSVSELERALVRLVTYALTASTAESPVFLRVQSTGGAAEIVVDGGANLAAAKPLRERVLADIDGGELALAIADTAVRRYGGQLEIAEGPQGVSFRMTLPGAR